MAAENEIILPLTICVPCETQPTLTLNNITTVTTNVTTNIVDVLADLLNDKLCSIKNK